MKKITFLFAVLISVISINAAPYLKGSFNSWGGDNPFSEGKTTVQLMANTTYSFKIEDNGTWYGNNGTMDANNCTNWTFTDNAGDAKISTTFTGNYVFTWNEKEHTLSVTYPTEEVQMDYYITGSSNLVGGAGWEANEIKMTKINDTYTHTFSNLAIGEYQFKITNGSWNITLGFFNLETVYEGVTPGENGNIAVKLTTATDLTITLKGSTITTNLPPTTIFTIAGSSKDLFGTSWDNANATNNMTIAENNIWTKTYSNVTLSAGDIEYKIIKNYNWNESYPNDNAKLNIPAAGNYDVTFTFNANDKTVNAVAEESKETPVNVENIIINNIYVQNGMIMADEEIAIFTITGQNVTDMNGNLAKGVYIVKSANATAKVIVK